MTNSLESSTSSTSQAEDAQPSGWLKLGVVAAASVLVGGLAAVWWYRNTLTKLHQTEETASNPDFGIPEDDPDYEA
jgi:hypothetical protein